MRTGTYNYNCGLLCLLIPTALSWTQSECESELRESAPELQLIQTSLHLHVTISCVQTLLTLLLGAPAAVSMCKKSCILEPGIEIDRVPNLIMITKSISVSYQDGSISSGLKRTAPPQPTTNRSYTQMAKSSDLLEKCDLQQQIYQVMTECKCEMRKRSSVHVTYLSCSVVLSHTERFIEEGSPRSTHDNHYHLPTYFLNRTLSKLKAPLPSSLFVSGLISRKKANQYSPAISSHQSQPMQQQPTLQELT